MSGGLPVGEKEAKEEMGAGLQERPGSGAGPHCSSLLTQIPGGHMTWD